MNSQPISEPPIKPNGDQPATSIPNPNYVPPPKPTPGGRGPRPPQKPGKGMPLPGRM